jgi:hypothetical protein
LAWLGGLTAACPGGARPRFLGWVDWVGAGCGGYRPCRRWRRRTDLLASGARPVWGRSMTSMLLQPAGRWLITAAGVGRGRREACPMAETLGGVRLSHGAGAASGYGRGPAGCAHGVILDEPGCRQRLPIQVLLILLSWLPSVSRGRRSRLGGCAPVLAAVKQSALDRGCGPALFEDGGTGSKNGPRWVRSA